MTPPPSPDPGDRYFDTGVGTMKVYIGGDWHSITSKYNNKRFYWMEDTNLPYAKILNSNWLMDHYEEIIQWLNETGAGTYSPELASIMFESEESATFFRLKWG